LPANRKTMADSPDLKESVIVQILKYWPVKYLIVALLALLVWSGFYHFYRCHLGLNSRFLWGAGECIECKVIDSTKHDTFTVYKAVPVPNESGKPSIAQSINHGDNNAAGRDNKGAQGGTNNKNHIVSGDHDTVGVNGDVNNYNAVKQRLVTYEVLIEIISHIPNKTNLVSVIRPADKESVIYAGNIDSSLRLNGYNNIKVFTWADPNFFDSVRCKMQETGTLSIFVGPASNVKP
jgi:phosphoribosylanthranilate isomerase